MKKIIIAPDSFKGTLSSFSVAEIIKKAVCDNLLDTEIICVPIADGGEGTIEAFGAKKIDSVVSGPHFDKINSYYGILDNTAIIEIAACAGLAIAGERKDPSVTTSYGAGELILYALDRGYNKIILALGGSCTNDCGCGIASALGVKFYNKNNQIFIPTGKTLSEIKEIDMKDIDKRIKNTDISVMCDVVNPLYGENGAAYVFAPQKGADEKMVAELDRGLRHVCDKIKEFIGLDLSEIKGGGAAGGIGAGAVAFLGGKLIRGIDIMLETVDFKNKIKGADLIITGEGKFDSQSLSGKAVYGIADLAQKNNIPCVVICGSAGDDIIDTDMGSYGITSVFSIQREPLEFKEAVLKTEKNLYYLIKNIIKLYYSNNYNK